MSDTDKPELKRFVVSVATDVILEGRHWFSPDRSWAALDLDFISAPDSDTAEAIAAYKVLKFRREETPLARILIQGIDSKEL